MKINIIAIALGVAVAAATVVPASAQQAAATTPAVGITVTASASVNPTSYIEEVQLNYTQPRGGGLSADAAIAQLRKAVPSSAVIAATPYTPVSALNRSVIPMPVAITTPAPVIAIATLRLAPDSAANVLKDLEATHWIPATSKLVAADEDALMQTALTKAVEVARHRAEAIANAEGRHIGKLLNVSPNAYDFLESFRDTLNVFNPSASVAVKPVTASGLFTFELLP